MWEDVDKVLDEEDCYNCPGLVVKTKGKEWHPSQYKVVMHREYVSALCNITSFAMNPLCLTGQMNELKMKEIARWTNSSFFLEYHPSWSTIFESLKTFFHNTCNEIDEMYEKEFAAIIDDKTFRSKAKEKGEYSKFMYMLRTKPFSSMREYLALCDQYDFKNLEKCFKSVQKN